MKIPSSKVLSDVSVDTLVNDIMTKYDKNQDGRIDTGRNDENVFIKKGFLWKKDKFTRGELFKDANTHTNQDGFVTKQELKNFIKTFDIDNDNKLSTRTTLPYDSSISEVKDFESKYSELKGKRK